ncbi:MAG: flagellar basal body P-ring formation chaperone FlgA [Planctomycetes bacterium]|nr:flagellar basal body P-ring formation chaperone FlgA [Planctomycetota bacterium]
MPRQLAIVAVLLAFALAPAQAASVRFKRTVAVASSIITLADVAEIADDDADARERLANVQLVPSPAAGETLSLRFDVIRARLQAHGVNLAQLDFSGPSVVDISRTSAPATPDKAADIAQWKRRRAEETAVAAVTAHVQQLEPRLGRVRVAVEIDTADIETLATSESRMWSARGAGPPWDAPQRITLRSAGDANGGREIMVTCRLTPLPYVVTAASALPRGRRLTRADIAWSQVESADDAFTALDDLLGRETTRTVRAGEPIRPDDVRNVPLVRVNDIVTVSSRRPGVLVRRQLKARADGGMGEQIPLVTFDGRQSIVARVTGFHEAEVLSDAPEVLDRAIGFPGAGPPPVGGTAGGAGAAGAAAGVRVVTQPSAISRRY